MSQPAAPAKAPLLVIFLTVFIDLLGFGMVLPLLPIYGKMFSHDTTGKVPGLLLASFSAAQFLFAPIWGRLSDRFGRRPILVIGLGGSVFSYTVFGLAATSQSLLWLFIARIGAGICGATIPTAQAYIADMTTVENRTKGMALIGAAFGLGFTFGPLLGAVALWSAD
ncbi:MAG: MFS transporter, partial [Pirellulales bacterium]